MRQLRGEDLDELGWVAPEHRVRSLSEAQSLAPEVDELDCLAACADGRIVGIGAAGYRTPFGGASLVSLAVDPAAREVPDPTAALLTRIEERAGELTCLTVEVRIDAADLGTRAAVEIQGYGLVGATTSFPPPGDSGEGRGLPSVDRWVLRKRL